MVTYKSTLSTADRCLSKVLLQKSCKLVCSHGGENKRMCYPFRNRESRGGRGAAREMKDAISLLICKKVEISIRCTESTIRIISWLWQGYRACTHRNVWHHGGYREHSSRLGCAQLGKDTSGKKHGSNREITSLRFHVTRVAFRVLLQLTIPHYKNEQFKFISYSKCNCYLRLKLVRSLITVG